MLNMMIALFYRVMPDKLRFKVEGFSTQDFIDATWHLPTNILPERRKQRPYLSGILSKNEISKPDKYNRKLFYRVAHGAYLFNPRLALKVEGEWVNIYDLMSIDRLAPEYKAKGEWHSDDMNAYYEKSMAACKQELQALIEKNRGLADG